MGGGRVLRLVPGGVPGRAGRAEPSSRNRNQREERRGLGDIWRVRPVSGSRLRGKQLPPQPLQVSGPPQRSHAHLPRRHKGISRSRIWGAFPNSFLICYLSFLGKKKRKFSQTSLEADAFMILRFSGLKAQWIKDSRGWRFSLRAWGHGQVHGPQPRGQRSPAWPQAACPGPFLPAGRVAGAGHQRQIWAGSGYLLYTQAPRTGPGPGERRSLIIEEPMLGPGSRWRVLTLKAHPD